MSTPNPNFDPIHEIIQTNHDVSTLEGKISVIYERTSCLPEIVKKVERHDTELRFIKTVGTLGLTSIGAAVLAWTKTHFGWGK